MSSRRGSRPTLILCSPARRTRETLERVFPDSSAVGATEFEDELYGASAGRLLAQLRALPEDRGSAMLIGHNPAIGELAGELPARGERLDGAARQVPDGRAGDTHLRWPLGGPRAGSAELTAFVKPRELD